MFLDPNGDEHLHGRGHERKEDQRDSSCWTSKSGTQPFSVLRSWPERVSRVVARIEVERVARRVGSGAVRGARTVLSRIALIDVDDEVVNVAAALEPVELRTWTPSI